MEEGEVHQNVIPAAEMLDELVGDAVGRFMKSMTGSPSQVQQKPLTRREERDRQRQENGRIAREAAQRRVARKMAVGIEERVAKAAKRLNGVNVAGAIDLIRDASESDRDLLLIAERHGQNRSGVLKQFGAPRASVETAYLAEAGLASPEHGP